MIVLKNSYINLTTVLHNNDINMDEILSQLSEELPSDFNPNDYAVEWEITVSSPTDNWEMPKYTIEDLKIDIEPMLFDLNSDEINDLVMWILESWRSMKSNNQPVNEWEMVEQENIPDFQPFENTDVDYLSMLQ